MQVHDHLTLEELQKRAEPIANKRLWKRYQILILALQGRTSTDIASALSCSRRLVQSRVRLYNEQGPDSLTEKRHTGRPPRLAGPELERFRKRVEAGPRPDENRATFHGVDHQRILAEEFQIKLSLQAVYDLLHRLGLSHLMPRPQHKDADERVQEAFKEIVNDHLQAIQELHPDQEVRPYFQDEGRFGQQGTLCRVWAKKGSRPRGMKQTQFGYLYLLAAVCPTTGHACGLISPVLNVATINIFLKQFSEELPAGVHGVLIWDGAGFHTSPLVEVPANVSLIQTVPYSPELNPVENLWHYLRDHYWSLQVFPSIDALEESMMTAYRLVCLNPERMKTVCAAPYVKEIPAA